MIYHCVQQTILNRDSKPTIIYEIIKCNDIITSHDNDNIYIALLLLSWYIA